MNLNFSKNMKEKLIKKVFNAYTFYIVLGIIVFANVFLFPDLLNHSDIKLNDLSYLMNKQIEIIPTTNEKTGNSQEADNKIDNLEQEKPVEDTENHDITNNNYIIAVNNKEEIISSDVDSSQVKGEQDLLNISHIEAEESLTIVDESSKKDNIDVTEVVSVGEAASLEDNNKMELIITEDKISEEIDSNTNQSATSTNDSNTSEDTGVESNLNVSDNKNSEVVTNDKIVEDHEAFLKNENENLQSNIDIQEINKHERKLADFYYILLLLILLSSFILGLVMFIHKNYNNLRQTYYSTKSAIKIREYNRNQPIYVRVY